MAENLEKDASEKFRSAAEQMGKAKGDQVSFQEFVYLMSSQALIQLGIVPNPMTGKVEKSLPAAQHAIEILAMLEQKTKGNLTEEEAGVLANALYDLRMRYVHAVQGKAGGEKKPDA